MIQVLLNPPKAEWGKLLLRPLISFASLRDTVQRIFNDVRTAGDDAIRSYESVYDKVELSELKVSDEEFAEAEQLVDDALKNAIAVAIRNIRAFHEPQSTSLQQTETMPGVSCWRKAIPIEKVGLYVPGGSAPLFSTVLMLGIPAVLADCKEIILCSPPNTQGKINPAILYAAKSVGLANVFKIGGIQAIAAMTFGTKTVPSVYKILGPGNQYVMAAKQLASVLGVSIDMPAGPSEVMVLADHTAVPAFVASDLLSQAEHGPDSQVILVTNDVALTEKVNLEIDKQLEMLSRREIAEKSLKNSKMIVLDSLEEMMEMSNQYAPEHLILSVQDPKQVAEKVVNAGSVFLGNYAPESAGDYASGTNHSLPTSGYARSYGGVSMDSFVKKISFQYITPQGFEHLGPVIEVLADAEQLTAHKNAATLRLQIKP